MPRSSSSAGIFPVREQSEQEATLAGAEDYEGSHIFYADGLLDEEVGEEHLATNQVNICCVCVFCVNIATKMSMNAFYVGKGWNSSS